MKRVFLIVLDSFGIGAMPDSADYGDIGVNTLLSISKSEKFKINKSKIHTFFNVIFKLSFIYYLIWLIISIRV